MPLFRLFRVNDRYNINEHHGTNYFLCAGSLIIGPEYWKVVTTLMMIVVPSIFSFVFVNKYFIDRSILTGILSGGITCLLLATVLWSLFAVVTKDPGIIPRNDLPPEDLLDPNDPIPDRIRTKQVLVNGMPVNLKYCETCRIWRPPRTTHCQICDNCVECFDHHCPFLGTCIGARNYPAFYVFIWSVTLYATFVCLSSIGFVVVQIRSVQNSLIPLDESVFGYAVRNSPVVFGIILAAYCLMVIGFTGGLVAFHTYLLLANKTTKEACTNAWGMIGSPYDKGTLRTCFKTICGGKPPSKIRLKYDGQAEQVFEEVQVQFYSGQEPPSLSNKTETSRGFSMSPTPQPVP